mgnify:CR=1 FL=1
MKGTMIFVRIAALVLLAVGALLSVGACARRRGEVITVAGSTAFQPFAEKLAEQFMRKRPDLRISVQGGGSALGIQTALSGAAQIGMADLVELPPEAASLTAIVVARDGIAVIVNPANTVSNLSSEQVRAVFSGEIANWRQVGGDDRPIRVVSREAGSGTRTSFEQILGNFTLAPAAIVQDSNGTVRETVANDRDAIGYLSHGLMTDRVKAISVDGIACDDEAVIAGRYRLVRPVFFLVKGAPEGGVRDFIDYVLSDEGQKTIKDNGLLPAGTEARME